MKKTTPRKLEYQSPLIPVETIKKRTNLLDHYIQSLDDEGMDGHALSLRVVLPIRMFLLRTPHIRSEIDLDDFMASLTPMSRKGFRAAFKPFSKWMKETGKRELPELAPVQRGRKERRDIDWAPDRVVAAIHILARKTRRIMIPSSRLATATLGDWLDLQRKGGWRLRKGGKRFLDMNPEVSRIATYAPLEVRKILETDWYSEVKAREVILAWGWDDKVGTVDQNMPFLPIRPESKVSVSQGLLRMTLDSRIVLPAGEKRVGD